MKLTSPVFSNGHPIPVRYTCEGENLSPPLRWTGVPKGTEALALVCEDPDAPGGRWVHWILYRIPPRLSSLPEGFASSRPLPDGVLQGLNDFQALDYGGPCPPPGKAHRYHFRLHALAPAPSLPPGLDRGKLERAIRPVLLAEASLTGTYQRQRPPFLETPGGGSNAR